MVEDDAADRDADAIVFDIHADFGHFRKPQTAPSPDTYGIMPRTTAAGFIAAMVGLGRDSYYETFGRERSQLAVAVESPVRRQPHGMNYLETAGSDAKTKGANTAGTVTGSRQPTTIIMLSEPSYRLYVSVDDPELMDAIDAAARGADPDADGGQQPVYTPTMGKSQHITWIEYVGRFPIRSSPPGDETGAADDGTIAIRSAVPGDLIPLEIEPGQQYVTERTPAYMRADDSRSGRRPDGSQTVTYAHGGGPITLRARDADYAIVGEDHVAFS